jgi:hypothetical protein
MLNRKAASSREEGMSEDLYDEDYTKESYY